MTIKQKALKLLKEMGCEYELHPQNWTGFNNKFDIEVFAPEGYVFEEELQSYICHDWKDVLERLSFAWENRHYMIHPK